ncbi:outer membrane protein [Sphingomonas sp. Mn802worker]|uniref:outer membrane protein n=1 Tax=Sphingomonas sp. Mn802worker TaxID=629773 RepID=UPI000A01182E|nr:porin family protein [Sphingomonas sp. Mn802worker]
MKTASMMAAIAVALTAMPAMAQYELTEAPTHTGPRIEAKIGWDRPTLDGLLIDDGVTYRDQNGKSGLAYGGEVGYDVQLNSVVVGAYAGVDGSTAKDCAEVFGLDRACVKAGRNITVGGRIGINLDGTFMLYAKGGYSNGRIGYEYRDFEGFLPDESYGDNLDGYHVGGGLEFTLGRRVYNRVDYTYTDYSDLALGEEGSTAKLKTARHQVTYGLGYRF